MTIIAISPSLRAQAKQSIFPQHFPVIASASEAIHFSAKTSMDCFVASLLAMTIITIRPSLQRVGWVERSDTHHVLKRRRWVSRRAQPILRAVVGVQPARNQADRG